MSTSNAAIPNLQGEPRAPSSASLSAVDSDVVVSSHAPPRPRSSAEQASLLRKAVHRLQYYAPPIESVRTVLDDFQDFIQQGNMIDLAVGLILGKAFTDILNSFVVDILTPIISLFSARDAGAVTINYGLFLENIVNFIINAIFLYVAIKKFVEVVFKRNVSVKKQCPFCKEFIKGAATVCKECGSQLTRPQQ
ncbi:Large conductance mechanosensitive ion channel, partial [Globisporangium splendens]